MKLRELFSVLNASQSIKIEVGCHTIKGSVCFKQFIREVTYYLDYEIQSCFSFLVEYKPSETIISNGFSTCLLIRLALPVPQKPTTVLDSFE